MQSFKFSKPYLYPDLEKVDKDTKGNPINTNGELIKKWCIRYKITFPDGGVEYRKEYGKAYTKQHNIGNLNSITDLKKKIQEFEILLEWVNDDLTNGIDPNEREELLKKATLQAIEDSKRFKYKYVFEKWFDEKNYTNPIPSKVLSAKNLKSFHLNQFLPYLEENNVDHDLRLVTDDLINSFIKKHYDAGDWGAFTSNVRIGWISGLITYAFKKKIIPTNPMIHVQKINEDKIVVKNGVKTLKQKKQVRFNIYTDEEKERIFAYVHNTKDEAIFKTLHFAFIRFSEIFRLKVSNLDLENNRFKIEAEIAKGQRDGETAFVPIFPELKECLTRYIKNQFGNSINPSLPLFPLDDDITKEDIYNNFYTRYMTVLRALKNDKQNPLTIKKTPYALKHTGAELFIMQNKALNISPFEIMEALKDLMRHKDFATTQKYMKKDLGIDLNQTTKFSFGKVF
ncbi:site-specific integrase [Pedobacter aquatilis]|uniref:tyrosine-type recombinase/integrase n=1 Tax=Pedobacter aquatilis TaxID=351343 RepID=UPI00292D8CD9|nr:site-specific integrase [Pedobacter aquatilis]